MVKTGTGYKTFLYAPSGRRRGRFRPAVGPVRAEIQRIRSLRNILLYGFSLSSVPVVVDAVVSAFGIWIFSAFLLVLTLPEILPPADDVSLQVSPRENQRTTDEFRFSPRIKSYILHPL